MVESTSAEALRGLAVVPCPNKIQTRLMDESYLQR
jgi:hypothetical protein